MGKKKNVQRSPVFQKQSSTAVGTPGGQAAGSKKDNCDDATSGSDATRLLLLQKVALVQKSDNFFYSPWPPTKTQSDKNQPLHMPTHQSARPHPT